MNKNKGLKHDVWQDAEELTALCLSGEIGTEERTLLEPNSKIIYSFYAVSHFDAMTKYYKFMDWGTYETEHEIDKEPYDLNEASKRAAAWFIVDEILWKDWDPIGINDVAPKDEYRSYVPQILYLILQNHSLDEVAAKLYQIESEVIGVIGNRERCKRVAEKIQTDVERGT